jgi:hypothetical protein
MPAVWGSHRDGRERPGGGHDGAGPYKLGASIYPSAPRFRAVQATFIPHLGVPGLSPGMGHDPFPRLSFCQALHFDSYFTCCWVCIVLQTDGVFLYQILEALCN